MELEGKYPVPVKVLFSLFIAAIGFMVPDRIIIGNQITANSDHIMAVGDELKRLRDSYDNRTLMMQNLLDADKELIQVNKDLLIQNKVLLKIIGRR